MHPFLIYFIAFLLAVILFVLQKKKVWYDYIGLSGAILFFIYTLLRFLHYPFQSLFATIGATSLLVALIATLAYVARKKRPSTIKTGVILCLYGYMFLQLVTGGISYYHRMQMTEEITNKLSSRKETK